jgi:hypothetical protein
VSIPGKTVSVLSQVIVTHHNRNLPQRQVIAINKGSRSKDSRPLGCARINSTGNTVGSACVTEGLHIEIVPVTESVTSIYFTVGAYLVPRLVIGGATGPVLRALNI